MMDIKSVRDPSFAEYGCVLEGYNFAPLVGALVEGTPKPAGSVVYTPGDEKLEALGVCKEIGSNYFGGMPIQVGYCNGSNNMLNCLEYHRDSEVNVAADDIVLLLARQQDIAGGRLDTSKVVAFLLPAGTAAELYATTLHYAPCNGPGSGGFRVAVVLPKGTNTKKPDIEAKNDEDRRLFARNKWLLALPGTVEAESGAYVGLTGGNIESPRRIMAPR